MPANNRDAHGWAVYDSQNGVLIRTVSDTRRSAIVNWLCTEGNFLPTMTMSDGLIEDEWQARRGAAVAIQIAVKALQPQPPT